jgi:Tol biopolymer transport system component
MIEVSEASDGKLLARGGDGGVWMMHTDGSQRSRFADFRRVNSLGSCGRYAILLSQESDTKALVRVDRDGTHPATLVRGNLWSPVCSADGNFVFYATFEQPQKIWKVPILGGTALYVSDVPGDQLSGRLTVSPDGKLLAFPYTQYGRVPSEGWKIGLMPVSGGRLVKQFKVPGGIWGVRWSPNGAGLQYVVTQSGAGNIWEQPLAGGKAKQLTHFTTGQIFDFNWSSDRTRLLLTRGNVNSDAVLLSNLR